MRVHYDKAADALYIRLSEAAVVDSEQVRPGVVLDFDADNRLVSIELLSLSKQLPDADVGKLQLEVA